MVKIVNACLPLLSYSSTRVIISINNVDIYRMIPICCLAHGLIVVVPSGNHGTKQPTMYHKVVSPGGQSTVQSVEIL